MFKRESTVLTNEDNCSVISYYPILQLQSNTDRIDELNKRLEEVNEMSRYVGNCEAYFPAEYGNKKKEIIGDYNVLYISDSISNIEFLTKFTGLSKVEYRNVFVNLKTQQLMEENKAIPNIERGKLYPYVKKFADSTGINIDLKAYESNSNYAIMFGRTKTDLVLYLGMEGEFGGYHKILIPLDEATK
ncbi:MAG: hypothetical protein ACTHLE_21945 [Agriterribacter sp.]